MDELPFQNLFSQLRNAGLPLGLNDYQLFLSAIQGGYGIHNRSALRRLCHVLWSTSLEDKKVIDYYFDQTMMQLPEKEIDSRVKLKVSERMKKPRNVVFLLLLLAVSIWIVTQNKADIPESPSVSSPPSLPEPPSSNTALEKPISPSSPTKVSIWRWWIVYGTVAVIVAITVTVLFVFLLPRKLQLSTRKLSSTSRIKVTQEVSTKNKNSELIGSTAGKALKDRFLLRSDYLPITQRRMRRNWRYLSRTIREGALNELDIDATVREISCQGVFLRPVLKPSRVNRASLLILVDYGGSMIPFQSLSERIVNTAKRGGRLGSLGTYYFQNCPTPNWDCLDDYLLYSDISAPESAQRTSRILNQFASPQLGILIFSDAGAARGGLNETRFEMTRDFLTFIKQKIRSIVWVNPLPESRWFGTTAEPIATQVAMVEANQVGMDAAISMLRGKYRETR